MIERASEIRKRALEKLGAFTEGQFVYIPYTSTQPEARVEIKATALEHSDPETPTAPQAKVQIIYSGQRGLAVEYNIDPTDLSTVARRELRHQKRKLGLFGKIFQSASRILANSSDISILEEVIRFSEPTLEFQRQIQAHQRQLSFEDADMERLAELARQRKQRAIDEENARIREKWRMLIAEKRAAEILHRIREAKGDKYLGLVVDDHRPKFESLRREYYGVKDRLSYTAMLEWLNQAEDAVRVIIGIQKLNTGYNKVPVVVFMDGNLPGKYGSGLKTTTALKAKLDEAGLPMPFLVGNAGERFDNTLLAEKYPDQYIAATRREPPDKRPEGFDWNAWELDPWKAIESAFKPNLTTK